MSSKTYVLSAVKSIIFLVHTSSVFLVAILPFELVQLEYIGVSENRLCLKWTRLISFCDSKNYPPSSDFEMVKN